MTKLPTRASRLALKVVDAKNSWEDAGLKLEEADAEQKFAEKRLVLARQELVLERNRLSPDDDWEDAVTDGIEFSGELLAELRSVQLVGEPIGQAARSTLAQMRKASLAKLATRMRNRGFRFASDVPVRELHGALVKQPWASKDRATDEWEYVRGA